MAERRSYDSIDDVERLMVNDITKERFPDISKPFQPTRQRNRLWSLAGYTALMTLAVTVGYIGGIYSSGHSRGIGPLGALDANSPVYRELGVSEPVIVKATHIGTQNPYTGAPTGKTNQAWRALMQGYEIRAPRRLLQPGQESIPLVDGSGDVVGSLGVFHYLHCLDSIRHQIAGKGCHDSDWGKEGVLPAHFDHCIESLRQWLICQPDLTLRTTYWDRKEDIGYYAQANNTVEHTCMDWSVVAKWTQERQLTSDDGLVKTPAGDVWPWIVTAPPICSTHDKSQQSKN